MMKRLLIMLIYVVSFLELQSPDFACKLILTGASAITLCVIFYSVLLYKRVCNDAKFMDKSVKCTRITR